MGIGEKIRGSINGSVLHSAIDQSESVSVGSSVDRYEKSVISVSELLHGELRKLGIPSEIKCTDSGVSIRTQITDLILLSLNIKEVSGNIVISSSLPQGTLYGVQTKLNFRRQITNGVIDIDIPSIAKIIHTYIKQVNTHLIEAQNNRKLVKKEIADEMITLGFSILVDSTYVTEFKSDNLVMTIGYNNTDDITINFVLRNGKYNKGRGSYKIKYVNFSRVVQLIMETIDTISPK